MIWNKKYRALFPFLLGLPVPVIAQDTAPPLPPLLADCKFEKSLAPASYSGCFLPPLTDYYGRLFIRSDMPAFDFSTVAAQLDKNRKASLAKRVKNFFLPNTTDGSLVATVTLMPSNTVIGVYELARFHKSRSRGFTIDATTSVFNGYVGPYFQAQSGTAQLNILVRYVYTKDQGSILSKLVADASTLLSGEGILTGKPILSAPTLKAVQALETAITQQFGAKAAVGSMIQLNFNPASTMAVYRAIPFGGVSEDKPGALFMGAVPLRSALVDLSPRELDKSAYTNGGYGTLATNPIQNRTIGSATLRDHVSQKMGADYARLTDGSDEAGFLVACQKLKTVIEDAGLGLNADDQLAATWSFIAANPLLSKKDVRGKYCLHASEISGDMLRPRLDLPKIDSPPPTSQQEAILAPAMAAAQKANESKVSAQSAINIALEALNKANLPVAPAGYEKKPGGLSDYRGQSATATGSFYGVFVDMVSTRKNNRFEGSMVLSAGVPIFEGAGRYTPASGNAGFAYTDYVGDFRANYFKGFGIMRWPDGREFHGEFAADEPAGYGIVYTKDGTRFYGHFSGPQAIGSGDAIRRAVDGSFTSGHWVSGMFMPD